MVPTTFLLQNLLKLYKLLISIFVIMFWDSLSLFLWIRSNSSDIFSLLFWMFFFSTNLSFCIKIEDYWMLLSAFHMNSLVFQRKAAGILILRLPNDLEKQFINEVSSTFKKSDDMYILEDKFFSSNCIWQCMAKLFKKNWKKKKRKQ